MNCDKNFKKGFVIGSLFGGALVAFGMSKKGKELREKAMDYSQELYGELRKKMIEWGEMSKDAYEDMVKRAVDEFARRKGMAIEMKNALVERLKERFDDLQTDLLLRKVKARFSEEADKTKEGFDKVVHEIVDEFEKKKDINGLMKYRLVRDLKRKWEEVNSPNDDSENSSSEGWR
jgi:gas vesicle protein